MLPLQYFEGGMLHGVANLSGTFLSCNIYFFMEYSLFIEAEKCCISCVKMLKKKWYSVHFAVQTLCLFPLISGKMQLINHRKVIKL